MVVSQSVESLPVFLQALVAILLRTIIGRRGSHSWSWVPVYYPNCMGNVQHALDGRSSQTYTRFIELVVAFQRLG